MYIVEQFAKTENVTASFVPVSVWARGGFINRAMFDPARLAPYANGLADGSEPGLVHGIHTVAGAPLALIHGLRSSLFFCVLYRHSDERMSPSLYCEECTELNCK